MQRLLKVFGGSWRVQGDVNESAQTANQLKPHIPFVAIGDVHGRIDLLRDILARVDPENDQQLVFLGDYIDRGPDSAATLEQLYKLEQDRAGKVVCLKGNHEQMMCDFIDDPLGRGARWLRYGGRDTLRSYGIADTYDETSSDDILQVCDALEDALPTSIRTWLANLPLSWNTGNVWCVHAAMDPNTAPDCQRSRTLLWGHKDFLKSGRRDGVCVVHGHTIVGRASNANSRVSIDTGAYRTGRLTAAHISDQGCQFFCT